MTYCMEEAIDVSFEAKILNYIPEVLPIAGLNYFTKLNGLSSILSASLIF